MSDTKEGKIKYNFNLGRKLRITSFINYFVKLVPKKKAYSGNIRITPHTS